MQITVSRLAKNNRLQRDAYDYISSADNHATMLERLQEIGQDAIYVCDAKKRSILAEACSSGNLRAVELLLSWGARVDTCDKEGDTPLFAVFDRPLHENIQAIIALLLKAGANINHKNQYGFTALHCALLCRDVSIVSYVLEQGAAPVGRSTELPTPLFVLAEEGDSEDFGPDEYKRLIAPLLEDKSILEYKNDENQTVLVYAILHNAFVLARVLIEYGADVTCTDIDGCTLLHLITHIDEENNIHPFWIPRAQKEVALLLVSRGLNPNVCTTDGISPLRMAVKSHNAVIAQVLLEHGADPELCPTGKRLSPLQEAKFDDDHTPYPLITWEEYDLWDEFHRQIPTSTMAHLLLRYVKSPHQYRPSEGFLEAFTQRIHMDMGLPEHVADE